MTLPNTISPHEGLGPIRFGLARADVLVLIGEPDEPADESIPGWITWTYSYYGVQVTLSEDAECRCTHLWTEDPRFLVRGTVVLGLTVSELANLASTLDLGPCVPKIDPDLGATFDFPESDVEISFHDEVSDHMSWSAEIDSNDEYVFPPAPSAA
jgi:hypothetical protein